MGKGRTPRLVTIIMNKPLKTNTTVFEKICPVCFAYVEVFPDRNYECEYHWRRADGRVVRCEGSGGRIEEGTPRTRQLVRLVGFKSSPEMKKKKKGRQNE